MSKANSSLNLAEALAKSKSEGGSLLGKPPPAPVPGGGGAGLAAIPPVTAVLPKLIELMEHAAQQQAALQVRPGWSSLEVAYQSFLGWGGGGPWGSAEVRGRPSTTSASNRVPNLGQTRGGQGRDGGRERGGWLDKGLATWFMPMPLPGR